MTKLFLLLACVSAIFAAEVAGQTPEKDAARVPLENYIKGHATGDGEYMRKAFHTEGNLIFIREGKFSTRSFAEYIGGFTGKPAADEAQRKRSIDSIDVGQRRCSEGNPRLPVHAFCRLHVAPEDRRRMEDRGQDLLRRAETETGGDK